MINIHKALRGCLVVLLLMLTGYAKGGEIEDKIVLEQWRAGAKVSPQSVMSFGIERCFMDVDISDAIFKRMYGKSFKKDCTIALQELRYIKVLHYNSDKQICLGEIVCNKEIVKDLIDIFKVLYSAQYPIEKMLLIDDFGADDEVSCCDNNSSAFNFRYVAGTTILSNHSTGRAVDINPRYNPYVKVTRGKMNISPKNGESYINRSTDFLYKMDKDDLCVKEFVKRGFTWGGDWVSLKDYMHFEKPQPIK